MANLRAMKLFAVAMLGGATTAHANTSKPEAHEPQVERIDKNGTIDLRIKPSGAQPVTLKPRVLPNLRPACGNTGGKSPEPRPSDCTASQIRDARAQATIDAEESRKRSAQYVVERRKLMSAAEAIIRGNPALKARVLIDGSPACGNTMSKASPPAFCRISVGAAK